MRACSSSLSGLRLKRESKDMPDKQVSIRIGKRGKTSPHSSLITVLDHNRRAHITFRSKGTGVANAPTHVGLYSLGPVSNLI